MVAVGDNVIYVDPRGVEHNALVTAAWTQTCINLVIINPDESQKDDYGRKIQRFSSVVHESIQPAHGNYWK